MELHRGVPLQRDMQVMIDLCIRELQIPDHIVINLHPYSPLKARREFGHLCGMNTQSGGHRLNGLFQGNANWDPGERTDVFVFMGHTPYWTLEMQCWTMAHEMGHAHQFIFHTEEMKSLSEQEKEDYADEIADRLHREWLRLTNRSDNGSIFLASRSHRESRKPTKSTGRKAWNPSTP